MKYYQLITYSYLVLLLIVDIPNETQGQLPDLQCYSCVSLPGDNTCLTNPERVTGPKIVNCENGWCTIIRQELTDTPGEIISFLRGCEKSKPLYLDNVIEDAHHVFYFRTCRTSRCNKGDGLRSGSGSSGSGGDSDGLIIVPQDGSFSNTSRLNPYLFIIILPLLSLVFLFQ